MNGDSKDLVTPVRRDFDMDLASFLTLLSPDLAAPRNSQSIGGSVSNRQASSRGAAFDRAP